MLNISMWLAGYGQPAKNTVYDWSMALYLSQCCVRSFVCCDHLHDLRVSGGGDVFHTERTKSPEKLPIRNPHSSTDQGGGVRVHGDAVGRGSVVLYCAAWHTHRKQDCASYDCKNCLTSTSGLYTVPKIVKTKN